MPILPLTNYIHYIPAPRHILSVSILMYTFVVSIFYLFPSTMLPFLKFNCLSVDAQNPHNVLFLNICPLFIPTTRDDAVNHIHHSPFNHTRFQISRL